MDYSDLLHDRFVLGLSVTAKAAERLLGIRSRLATDAAKSIATVSLSGMLFVCGCAGGTPSESPTAPVAPASMTGTWNVVLTDTGSNQPTYTFGLNIAQGGNALTAQDAIYTGTIVYGNSCFNYPSDTGVGSFAGSSLSMTVTDPSTKADIQISGTLNAAATQVQGTFTFPQIIEGTRLMVLCGGDSGTATLTRQ